MKKSIMMIGLMLLGSMVFAQHKEHNQKERATKQSEKLKSELSLNDDQYATIEGIQEKYASKHDALRNDSTAERGNRLETLRTLRLKKEKEIEAVLTPEQKSKWKTLREERSAKRIIEREDRIKKHEQNLTSELKLSDDQVTKVDEANKQFRDKLSILRRESKEGMEAEKADRHKIRTEHDAAIKAILTDEQFSKWSSMKREKKSRPSRRKSQ